MNSILSSLAPSKFRTAQPVASVAVDEAFADFEIRVDSPAEPTRAASFAAETELMVATISRQLQSIEDQKNRLLRLLGDLGVAADF